MEVHVHVHTENNGGAPHHLPPSKWCRAGLLGTQKPTIRSWCCERKVIQEKLKELPKPFHKPICTQAESSIGSSTVPGFVVAGAHSAVEKAETLMTGRLLNISEDVTRFHIHFGRQGPVGQPRKLNARRDGRAMSARKDAVDIQLL